MARTRTGVLADREALADLMRTHGTLAGVARTLGVDPRTVGRAAAAHHLPTGHPGRPRTYPDLASLRAGQVRRIATPNGPVTAAGEYQRIADALTAARTARASALSEEAPPPIPKDAVRRAVVPRRRPPRSRRHGPAS